MTLRQDRMKSHFLDKGSCSKPPEAAVELAKQIGQLVAAKVARSVEEGEREAGFIQTKLPNLFKEGTRQSTNDAWARYVYGTGQSFNAGKHHLSRGFLRAFRKDPSWSAEIPYLVRPCIYIRRQITLRFVSRGRLNPTYIRQRLVPW